MISKEMLSLISSLLFLGLGGFVGYMGPRRLMNLSFSFGMISLAVMEFSAFMIGMSRNPLSYLFWTRIIMLGEFLLPAGWLLFSLTFARSNPWSIIRTWRPVVVASCLIPMTFLGLLAIYPLNIQLPMEKISSPFPIKVSGWVESLYVLLILGIVLVLMNLEQTFRASSGSDRWRIKFMVLGVGAILGFEIYEAGRVLLFSVVQMDSLVVRSTAFLIGNIMILFALVRHRLMNVNIFISRYVVYNSITLLGVGLYLLVVGTTIFGIHRYGGEAYDSLIPLILFVFLLCVMVLLLSDHFRRKIEVWVNTHFYKNKHDYRNIWQGFTRAVETRPTLDDFLPSFMTWLLSTIGTDRASLWLYDSKTGAYFLAAQQGLDPVSWTIPKKSHLIQYLIRAAVPLEVERHGKDWDDLFETNLEMDNFRFVSMWSPMMSGREMPGFIALGGKIARDSYDFHDLELMKTIAGQVYGYIQRVQLVEELSLAREKETFQILATFLSHDLKNYTSTLSLVAQNAAAHGGNPEFQKDAIQTIQNTADKMNELIRRVSSVGSKGLNFSRTEVDINRLVHATLANLQGTLSGQIDSKLEDAPNVLADFDQMMKVLTNLLLNASEAITEDGRVTIESKQLDNHIHLSVADNGCGMSPEFVAMKLFRPFRSTKSNGWGIGLFQCQQIIHVHGGRIEVESQEGKGSKFTVILPLQ